MNCPNCKKQLNTVSNISSNFILGSAGIIVFLLFLASAYLPLYKLYKVEMHIFGSFLWLIVLIVRYQSKKLILAD